MIPEWLDKLLKKDQDLVRDILRHDLESPIREELLKYISNYRITDEFQVSKSKILEFYKSYKSGDISSFESLKNAIGNCNEFIGDIIDIDTQIELLEHSINKTIIHNYIKFNKTMDPRIENAAISLKKPNVIADLICYNPKYQYVIPDIDSKTFGFISRPVLDAMYWWDRIKGPGKRSMRQFLFLYADEFIFYSNFRPLADMFSRWDVPTKWLLSKVKCSYFLNVIPTILQNSFISPMVKQVILSQFPGYANYYVDNSDKPLNERCEMLKIWELKSLEEFYKTVYINLMKKSDLITRADKSSCIKYRIAIGQSPEEISEEFKVPIEKVMAYYKKKNKQEE